MQIPRFAVWLLLVALLVLTGCGSSTDNGGTGTVEPLQLQLSADKAKIALGEAITFTTFLTNPNACAVNVHLGESYSGVCFANGSALQGRQSVSIGWEEKEILKSAWKIGFCGTCSYSLVVAIPPKGSISYKAKAKVKLGDKGSYLNFSGSDQDYLTLPFLVDGKYYLRATHQSDAAVCKGPSFSDPDARWLPKEHSIENGYAPDAKATCWGGTLTSNEILIEINARNR